MSLTYQKMHPELHLIMGCMYSGKSTELLKIIQHYTILDKKMFVINHKADTRYDKDSIVSHDKKKHPCFCYENLEEAFDHEKFKESQVVIIEEGQFFPGLKQFVLKCLDLNKSVFVAGLDGDSFQKPFGEILDLIPYCDSVKKLTALCIKCKDGTRAGFTRRIVEDSSQKLIGSFESFIPVCRYHLTH